MAFRRAHTFAMATDIAKLLLLYKCQENARIRAVCIGPQLTVTLTLTLTWSRLQPESNGFFHGLCHLSTDPVAYSYSPAYAAMQRARRPRGTNAPA